MTERDISGFVAVLSDALDKDDEKVGTQAAMKLLECALIDLNRIADCLSAIAVTHKGNTP